MMNTNPKVLVGAPVCSLYLYCLNEFLDVITNLSYNNYDILLLDNSKDYELFNLLKKRNIDVIKTEHTNKIRDMVIRDHNLLRKEALEKGYDYLFLLDQDVIPPRDAIERLIRHKKEVVAGLYFGHHILDLEDYSNKIMPFAWAFINKKDGFWGDIGYLTDDEIWSNKLIPIAFAGGGCLMIHRSILEKIEFRYDKGMDVWDDRWFGYDLHKNDYEMFIDTSVKCKHLYLKRKFDYHELKRKGLV